jgi:hypothetical protein
MHTDRTSPAQLTAIEVATRIAYLSSPIAELTIEEGPRLLLESVGITKIVHLEIEAAAAGVSHCEYLVESIGMDQAEAEDVIDAMEERRQLCEPGQRKDIAL